MCGGVLFENPPPRRRPCWAAWWPLRKPIFLCLPFAKFSFSFFLKSAGGIFIWFQAECVVALIVSLSPAQVGGKPCRARWLDRSQSIRPSIHSYHPYLPIYSSVLPSSICLPIYPYARLSIRYLSICPYIHLSPEGKVPSAYWSEHCGRCVTHPAQWHAFPVYKIGAIPRNLQGDSYAPST